MDMMAMQAAADRCVKCGLCLPVCPSYSLLQDEADSPRGRIALMEAYASGRLSPRAAGLRHLDRCLLCRACERVCPPAVPFAEMMVTARARWRRPWYAAWRDLVDRLLTREPLLRQLPRLAALLRGLRLERWPGPWSAALAGLEPVVTQGWSPPPASGPRVRLFLGCGEASLNQSVVRAAVAVLAAWGWRADLVQGACCGALDRHAGAMTRAAARRTALAARLAGDRGDAQDTSGDSSASLMELLYLSTGCAEDLRLLPGAAVQPRGLLNFLLACPWPLDPFRQPLALRVAVHRPCTALGSDGEAAAAVELLGRIPGLDLVSPPDLEACCGAAGNYQLVQPRLSAAIREPSLRAIAAVRADVLVTVNLGCALHLRAGLRRSGWSLPVLHPVQLLAHALAGTRPEGLGPG